MPIFLTVGVLIKLTSPGPIFFIQKRIGQFGNPFLIYKFRSMAVKQSSSSLITIGNDDSRITSVGFFIRKYKLDELPQLYNVLLGQMSLVGPRPEVEKYVKLYDEDQKRVLNLKPGITDMASIAYRNENEILSKQSNPEEFYIKNIMPDKIKINLKYQHLSKSWLGSIRIILKTIFVV
jgi:lipopolysaccharide/colanic/teichoic acid biosynthesis glycosyltransferase